MQKIEKTNERSHRYLKTDQRTTEGRRDGRTTDGQRRLLRTPSGEPGSKMNNGQNTHILIHAHRMSQMPNLTCAQILSRMVL